MSAIAIPFPRARRHRRIVGALRQLLRVSSALGLVAAVGVWALLLRPQFLGGPAAYVMVSGMSMEPTLQNGDLVVAHRQDTYRVGDIVLYRVPEGETGAGSLIIHRIVGGSEAAGWVVQGDNKDVPDLWRPRNGDVVGTMWAGVPGAGTVLARGLSPFALASISTLLAAFLGLPGTAVKRVEARPTRRRPSEKADGLSVPATVLALTEPPPLKAPVPSTDLMLPVPGRTLAFPPPAPLATAPVSMFIDISKPVSVPGRIALPVRASAGTRPAREVAVSRSQKPSPASWGEAAWTARDLDSAAADRIA